MCCIPLTDPARSLQFTDTFAFGAPKVIGHFLTIWMINYSDKVIVGGMSSKSCISSLLYASNLGLHTSVLFLNRVETNGEDVITATTYVWEHRSKRPNAHTLPIACPVCHALQSWCPADSVVREDGSSFTLPCLTKSLVDGKRVPCHGSYVVGARPPGGTYVEGPYVGAWHSYNTGAVAVVEDKDVIVVEDEDEAMVEDA